jgi:chitinase
VKRHPANPSWLYAATSVGIFVSENGGATWSTSNEGPANIRVRELFWIDNNTLGAATYGRGMFRNTVASGGPADYQDLWWGGAPENGWGMSITQHGATIFAAMYIYDAQGRALWVVLPGGTWNAGFSAYSGTLYIPSGSWFGNYDVTRFVPGAPVGSATIAFNGANAATLSYTIDGASGTKSLQRQLFGPQDSTPVATYGDLWWGGTAQNGWGVAINQQYRSLFSVWYTYDAAGKTVWYVVPAGNWTAANVYTGTAYRTTGSAWLGAPYDPALLNAQPVGTVTLTFTDLNNGVMSYTIDGVSDSKPITRQSF